MLDKGHEMTDEILSELENKIQATYSQAVKEMTEKVDLKLAKYSENLEKKQTQLADGKITKKEFDTWKKNQAAMIGNVKDLRDTLAEDLVHTDQIAADIINDYTPEVFALNMNYGTYQVEKLANINTSFVLYNKDTVNYLIAENPDLLPKAKINIPKDMKWNKQHVGNAVTQGILQGENSYKIAKRLQQVTDMDNRAAIRNARTMVTNAQSAGRVRSYKRAQDMGIKVRHRWSSIHDARTRHSHVVLDGQVRDLDEAFSNGLMFPGDSNGPGYEVYNCRCRVVPVLKGHEKDSEVNGKGFEKWEDEQAMPDPEVFNTWGGKKYGYVWNLMAKSKEAGHGADANNFFNALKSLGEKSGIGKPPQVWQAYLAGQLDAEDLKTFENIIKKYLPKQVDDMTDMAKAKKLYETFIEGGADKIHNASEADKQLLDKLFVPAKKDIDLYKGLALPEDALDNLDDVIKSYSSTTIDKNVAWDYAAKAWDMSDEYVPVVANVHVKAGTPMINTQEFLGKSGMKGYEKEITLGRNVKYEWGKPIKKVDSFGDEYYAVDVTVSPKDVVNTTTKATDVTKISKEAQDSLDKLKLKAGELMNKDEADTYKVNPFYDKNKKATTKNCQTSAFAYECRRQGYDVIALPKYGLDIDDPEFKKILELQNELGQNAQLGWINKTTGKPPVASLKQDNQYFVAKKADMIKDLENAVGMNGERYIMGVRWEKGGAHAINVDRTSDGKLRIIDNQRGMGLDGKLEKNTWVGEEIEEYLEKVQNIRHLTRVDDCVPNAEYFNKIVVDTKKVKSVLPGSVSGLKPGEYAKVSKAAKDVGEKTATYYTKYKVGIIENTELDDALKVNKSVSASIDKTVNSKIDAELAKKSYVEALDSLDDDIAKEVKDIVEDVAKDNNMTYAEYWSGYAKGKFIDPELDDLLKDVKIIDKTGKQMTSAAKTTFNLDMDVINTKTMSGVWKELNQAKAGGGKFLNDITEIANKYGEKPGELWKKYYLTGKLDPDDVTKIETHLAKIYSKTDEVDDTLEAFMKKWKGKDLYDNDISVDEMNKIVTHIQSKGIIDESEVEKYFIDWANKKVKDDDIAKILGYKADKVDDTLDAIKAALPDKMIDLDLDQFDEAKKIIKKYYNSPDAGQIEAHYSQWKKGLLKDDDLDALFGKKAVNKVDNIAEHNEKILKYYKDKSLLNPEVPMDVADIAQNKYFKVGLNNASEYWNKYKSGEIKDVEIDKILGIKKTTDKVDDLVEIKKTMPTFLQDPNMPKDIADYLNTFPGTGNAHWKKYLLGEVDDSKLDDLLKKHASKPATVDLPDWVKDNNFDLIDVNTGEILDKVKEFEKIKKMQATDLEDLADQLFNKYDLTITKAKDIAKNSGLNIPEKKVASKATMKAVNEVKENLPKSIYDLDSETFKKVNPIVSKNNTVEAFDSTYWTKYVKGKIDDPDLDDILGISKSIPKSNKLDFLENKYGLTSVEDIADKLWEDTEIFDAVTKAKDPGTSYMKYLKKYVKGEIDNPEIDIILGLNKAVDKTDKISAVFDKSMVQGKKMSAVMNELKKQGSKVGNDFYYKVLQPIDEKSPSKVWNMYLKGELTDAQNDLIEDYLKKHYVKDITTSNAAKTVTQTVEKSEELIEAEKKLKKAEDDLKAAKKALKDNIPDKDYVYSGIWKDQDVTLKDYADKKDTIAGKKQYYHDTIKTHKDKIDEGSNIDWHQNQIDKLEDALDKLEQFEIKGQQAEKYYKDIKKAEDIVSDTRKEVQALTPVGEAFTEERKANALWVKNSDDYEKLDPYYDKVARDIKPTRTSRENDGMEHYTWGSMPFNSPLAGFKGDRYTNFVGVNKVDINVGGYGDKIRGLTSLIEKSSYDKDIWVNTAQSEITIESFLGIKPGTLHNMTEAEAQQFVGVQNEIPQFISAAVEKGGGSYVPGNMTINVYCPGGSEILYILEDGHFGKSEREMILQRGGTYKLTKIYKGKGMHDRNEWIVDLELHPEYGYDKFQQTK